MYFDLLKALVDERSVYRVFLDIKDTRGWLKVRKLKEVLRNNFHDFSGSIINTVQNMRSDESDLLQLADLLIGAVSYKNRGKTGSPGKLAIVRQLQTCSGITLKVTTSPDRLKVNILRWEPKKVI